MVLLGKRKLWDQDLIMMKTWVRSPKTIFHVDTGLLPWRGSLIGWQTSFKKLCLVPAIATSPIKAAATIWAKGLLLREILGYQIPYFTGDKDPDKWEGRVNKPWMDLWDMWLHRKSKGPLWKLFVLRDYKGATRVWGWVFCYDNMGKIQVGVPQPILS